MPLLTRAGLVLPGVDVRRVSHGRTTLLISHRARSKGDCRCLSGQPARGAPAGPVHAARNDWSRSYVGQPAGIGVPAFKLQLP